MAKLKDIKSLETKPKKKSAKEVPSIDFSGDAVKRYNEAQDQIANAEAVCKELAPSLIDTGCRFVFEQNCTPGNKPINSVNLVDDRGEKLMVTWTRKPKVMDAAAVEAFFDDKKTLAKKPANVNDYAVFVPVATFDAKIFLVANPKTARIEFAQERYDAFNEAVQKVADKFGVTNPLSCGKVFVPQPDFQERRFVDFDVDTNLDLMEVMPTSVSLETVRSDDVDGA